MTAKISSQLEALREQEKKLKARIKEVEAQAASAKRKEDTRLKVLIGAGMMADAVHHPDTVRLVAAILDRAITADRDREFLQAKGWLPADPPQTSTAAGDPAGETVAKIEKASGMDMSALTRTES